MGKINTKIIGLTLICFFIATGLASAQSLVADGGEAEKITSGFQFTEGPYWHPDGYLLFSDIPANTIYRWTPGTTESKVFMNPSGHSNGITADSEGNLILAQHDGMVSVVNGDKKVVVQAQSYDGKRLNSPNDVTVASDGTIYFTDPPFGVSDEDRELTFSGVYMLKPDSEPQLMFDGFDRPNGVVLTSDESTAYVNNTSSGEIMAFDVADNGELINGRDFASVGAGEESGAADGMVVDVEGRLYSTGPGGIYVFSADGEQIQMIEMPARVTNMGWGGSENKTLYLTTPSAIYRMKMTTEGVRK